MAKKNGKPGKDKKKLLKKPAAKPAAKKAAPKPAKKAAPVKKAAAKPVAKKPAAKAPAKTAAPAKGTKSVLKTVAKVVAGAVAARAAVGAAKKVAEKVAEKIEKPAKGAKGKAAANGKAGKADAAPKAKVTEVQEPDLDALAAEEEELVDEEVVLTDAEGRRYCRVKDCDQLSAVDGYCRYHYLALWKKIQVRKKILSEGKLERYIEELTARYPDKFLEMLRKDLRSEKEFLAAIQELEIDESAVDNEFEDEAQTYIDEVRGMEPTARDEEDF